MLGDKIGEETGKITGTRVLPYEGGAPKLESTMQATGTLLGVEVTNIATLSAVMRPDGTLYIEGQGVLMANDGAGVLTGQGIGRFTASGGVSYRGGICCQSASGSLERLNSTAIAYEADVDADQNILWRFFEWK